MIYFLIPYSWIGISYETVPSYVSVRWLWGVYNFNNKWGFNLDFSFLFGAVILLICFLMLKNSYQFQHYKNSRELIASKISDFSITLLFIWAILFFISLGEFLGALSNSLYPVHASYFFPYFQIIFLIMGLLILRLSNRIYAHLYKSNESSTNEKIFNQNEETGD